MFTRKILNITISTLVLVSLIFGGGGQALAQKVQAPTSGRLSAVAAMPAGPTDETKVPHYFGPYPNWANSPFTSPNVSVAIVGDGQGATASASVGANGAVTGITITDPGRGYTAATVDITGAGSGASANASVNLSGSVTSVSVDAGGTGYTKPVVSFSGGTNASPATPAIVLQAADGIVVTFDMNVGSADGGTFTLTVDSTTTSALAWNASAADIETALLLAAGSVSGSGPWVITFATAPSSFTIDGTYLTQVASPANQATATAFGGVDAVILGSSGFGYSMPTVDFDLPDDPNGVQARAHVPMIANGDAFDGMDATGAITAVIVDNPGSGYSSAPNVVIRDGTLFDPINGGSGALASATLTIQSVAMDTYGSGYASAPLVSFSDALGVGSGAAATAFTDYGAVTGITLVSGGSGYVTPGIRKFVDTLPGLTPAGANNLGLYIPVAVPDTTTYPGADYYEIAVVQYRAKMHSDLPATLMRGYVQLSTSVVPGAGVPLSNAMVSGPDVPIAGYTGVDNPHYLGPTIVATKDRPVRILFRNLLPTGVEGDLFLPTDTSLMGSGMGPNPMPAPMDLGTVVDEVRNPMCTEKFTDPMMRDHCFTENRATLHLHGGVSPWISDGTPHQWITPANENTPWPQGVSVGNVPDMNACDSAIDGCQTFYYTNQQSARLMFYHDHAWGITRLNVYAGEAAGYLITDDTEKALLSSGTIPTDMIPLVIQDKTFVPDAAQLAAQDPTWDAARWGGYGNFWYHHVYMPAQNPGDPSGMSAYGRWMYGPWFWPPAANTTYGPIANPYYDPNCNLDVPSTWQYQTDPFCEPQLIPGTPNISVGMEQFNDTPIVNGVAYPTMTLQPKSYRLRILSAANDRFFNFQWYVADSSTASIGLNGNGEVIGGTEVALDPALLAAAQTDPNVFPTPIQSAATTGPDWIQIGTEGGFLPAPVVVDGQQPTTWIIDPTRFDVGNVDKHSLLLAPAERADVIVDFSKFAGKTLILYNDAPAAFPARVSSYDYYTGAPDLSPIGAPGILPGYGPNTRTIMQVKIAAAPAAPAFNLTKLQNAFKHNANGTGVFEKGQHPIVVGQAAYNSAYGSSFAASGDCSTPGSTLTRCDGFVRINGTSTLGFNTLKAPTAKMSMPLQPKAIHDEMNSTTFDDYGRMQATLGLEAQPPVPGAQNVVLYPYVNPSTALIDGTNLPKGDVNVSAISSASDGTQVWRITHNGVDTHPIHFHLYDVQVLNRVTWDNIIIPPDATELGWKDTVRISPLEDTIVALRPIVPTLPWELPNSIRMLNPMMPAGSTAMFNNIDPQGNPTNPITNQLVNYGWEYVYHCHILSHEEMDMMAPVSLALPPVKPDGLAASLIQNGANTVVHLSWNDNSIAETAYVLQRNGVDIATFQSPLNVPNTKGSVLTFDDTNAPQGVTSQYQVVAKNTVGYGFEFPSLTVKSVSTMLPVDVPLATPTNLTAAFQAATGSTTWLPPRVLLSWTDNAIGETGFTIERTNSGVVTMIAPLQVGTGPATFVDTTILPGVTYTYRVMAIGAFPSAWSNIASVTIPVYPDAPAPANVSCARQGNSANDRCTLTWANVANETGYTVQRASDAAFTVGLTTANLGANVTTWAPNTNLPRNTQYYFRVRSTNAVSSSAWVNASPFPITTP
jgi:FtsP/CotA-like multicopper oxidase with cupredoxin domain